MTMITGSQYDRLPRYARDEIDRLERENACLLDDLQLQAGQAPPGNNTFVRETGKADRPLGRSVRVRFATRDGQVEAYVDHEGVLVARGDLSIVVHPKASNTVVILPGRLE